MVANPSRGLLYRENDFSLSPIRALEFDLARRVWPFRPTLAHSFSRPQAKSGAYSQAPLPPAFRDDDDEGVHPYRQPPSGQSRVYRVTRAIACTDGVYRRESAGTRPVVLRVA